MPSERPVIVISPEQRDKFFTEFNAKYGEDIKVTDFINLCIHLEEKQSILSHRRIKLLSGGLMYMNFDAKINISMLKNLQKCLTGSQDVQEFFIFMKENKKIKEDDDKIMNCLPNAYKMIPDTNNQAETISDSLYYESIRNKPRGHVLIVNYRSKRDGSHKDVESLEKVFRFLEYEPETIYDKSKDDLLKAIGKFAEDEEKHKMCHAAGLIVMSHGVDGALTITEHCDGCKNKTPYCKEPPCKKVEQAVEIEEILKKFKSGKLNNKPTFVIFQVCRVPFKSVTSGDPKMVKPTGGKGNVEFSVEKLQSTFPHCAILYTCRPTFESDRNTEKGAYFIQAICDILRANGRTMSLDQLFPAIAFENRTMNIVENANSEAIVPEMVTTMNKKFCF